MSIKLFEDQEEFVLKIRNGVVEKKSVVACAATGYGKSHVFIDISIRALERGKTVLILTESRKIFDQISRHTAAILINPEAKHFHLPANSLYIAMAQTLIRRREFIKTFDSLGPELLIIIDECHIGHFNKLLDIFQQALKIGFTATPDARWAKHLPNYYKGIVLGPQPHELVLMGRLAPYKHFARVAANLDLLKLHNGEFTEESQEEVFGTREVFNGLVEDLKNVPYKKCLVFTASIKDCESLYEELMAAKFRCVRVHSKMSDANFSYSLGMFTKGDINICISVGTLTKGFDFPAIDMIVIRRKTTSLPLFLQMCGRGSRSAQGKTHYTVLDYGANYLEHGMWDQERNWEDVWNRPRKKKDGVAPIKICPQCEAICAASASFCLNCGYEFEKKEVKLVDGKLVEITELYSKMVGKKLSELTPHELSVYSRLKGKKLFAARVAVSRDQIKEGFLSEYAKHMGYKQGWVFWKKQSMVSQGRIAYPDFELK